MTAFIESFRLPWRSVHRSLRWLGGGVCLLLTLIGLGVALYTGGANGWRHGLALYAFGAGYFWMCVMACLLLVASDARRLRLPGVQRAATGSVLLYGLISVSLPLVMFLPLGGDAVTIALVAALAATTGLAVALLPRYVMLVIGFLPALAVGMQHIVRIPFPGQPGFLPLGLAILAVLLAACAWSWQRLLHAEHAAEYGMGSSMVMQYRRNGAVSGAWAWSDLKQRDTRQHVPAHPVIRTTGIGPHAPVLALRVVLGESYAPQNPRGHGRRFMRFGLPLLLFVPVMAVMQAGEAHGDVLHKMLLATGTSVVGWLGVMGGLALMVTGSLQPRACLRCPGTTLSVLALLPGLGDASAKRHHLLRAVLGRPLRWQALLLAVVLAAAVVLHAGPLALLLVVLAQLGCMAVVTALALDTFSGRPLPGLTLGALLSGVGLLMIASTFAAVFATLKSPLGAEGTAVLAVLWALAGATLLWLGRRGWLGMRTRPHPFLES